MIIKDKTVRKVVIGAAFLWIGIGIWGVHECLDTAKLLKKNQRDGMIIPPAAHPTDSSPYLFSEGLSVPYIVFATAIASSVFVLFSIFRSENYRNRK